MPLQAMFVTESPWKGLEAVAACKTIMKAIHPLTTSPSRVFVCLLLTESTIVSRSHSINK